MPRVRGMVERRDAEGAALRGEGDPAGRRRAGREGRVQRRRRVGVDHAEAVGPTSRMPAARQTATQLALALLARLAGLGEAGREDDERAHARCAAQSRATSRTAAGGHGDHGELERPGTSRSEA